MKLALPLLILACACPAWGQAAGAYDPVGVYLDADGVLHSRTTDPDPRLSLLRKNARRHRKDGKFLYVSLPRLFAKARALQKSGTPLPDEVRFVGGMTRLSHVFVFPEEGDLVIAGTAEPLDATASYRPLGRISGRPALHLDDIATAIRTFVPGKNPDRLGCDIEVTREIQERINAKILGIGPTAQIVGFRKTCDKIAAAGGAQPVRYFGLDPDTRFALTCVEADYRLKQLVLGLMKSPVSKVRSYRSMLRRPEKRFRFSLESRYEALLVSPDGLSFELRGPSLYVNGGLLGDPQSGLEDMSPTAQRFINSCNANFEALTRSLVSWLDLCNLSDLSVLGALISKDRLADKAGWDLSWVLKGYSCRDISAPKSAATLCNYALSGRVAIYISGGVWIKPSEWAARRSPDEKVGLKASRPAEGWSASR